MTDKSSVDVDRRAFMKKAAAASAITVGAAGTSGTAVASSTAAPQDRTEFLLSAHADEVLSMLERDGVLADRSALPTGVENDFAGVAKGHEGAAKLTFSDGSEQIRVVKQVDAGTLTITVKPDEGYAFASLDTESRLVRYSPNHGTYDVSPQYCMCTDQYCGTDSRYAECCTSQDCDYYCHC